MMVSAPPRRAEVDPLDVVEVHRDSGHVAEEAARARRWPRCRCSRWRGAVEQQRVDAGLALDHVAAVARVPHEHVVAGAEEGDVVAPAAVDEVVAVAAEQHVGAVAAGDVSLPAPPSRVS